MRSKAIRKILFLGLALLIGCWSYAAQASCKPPDGKPLMLIMNGLKGVALMVDAIPLRYQAAVRCHGHETECGNDDLKALAADFKAYPEPLHPDRLVHAFSDMLKAQVMPFVVPGPDCKIPDILTSADREAFQSLEKIAESTPDMLTVFVRLNIMDQTTPHIAVLTTAYYRANMPNQWSQILMGKSIAIPLDQPDDLIAAKISAFADSLQVLTTKQVAN